MELIKITESKPNCRHCAHGDCDNTQRNKDYTKNFWKVGRL